MKKVYLIIGTRPDTIKMAPIYHTLQSKSGIDIKLVSTGQHNELLAGALKSFNLKPDLDIGYIRNSRSLTELTAYILQGLEHLLIQQKPDLVLIHGDTASCYSSALACFYNEIPFYHIEAGLRSYNLLSPYPEEFHRQTISRIASHHFVPTVREKRNLMIEGINKLNITVTGSTVHEAIQTINTNNHSQFYDLLGTQFDKIITLTLHRRENGVLHLQSIMNAIKNIAMTNKKYAVLFPVHPSPVIKNVSRDIFHGIENVLLTSPLDYKSFISLLNQSDLILTDSGGVQEEAAYLGRSVFILRDNIERYDGIYDGFTKIIGTDSDHIEQEVLNYLQSKANSTRNILETRNLSRNPSEIIADHIMRQLS